MDTRQQDNFRSLLTEAIIKLCQLEAVYINELRIEGTVCVVSDCASVMIAHFTECVGNAQSLDSEINDNSLEFVLDQHSDDRLSVDHTELMLPEVKDEHVLPDEIIKAFEEVGHTDTLTVMHGLCQEARLNADDSTAVDVKKSSGGQYQCPTCHKTWKLKRTLQCHLKRHCECQQHMCHHCSAAFTSEAALHVHITTEHGNWCDSQLSGQELAEKSNRRYRQGRHHDVALKTEQVDSVEHDSCHDANIHMPDTGEITDSYLEADGAEVLKQTDYHDQKMQKLSESHTTSAILETQSKYWNGRKTSTIMQYFEKVHVETPQGLYQYKCCLCHKMFKIRTSLYEHINSHIGKRRYACSQCGDRFVHHSSLHNHVNNKHMRTSQQQVTMRYLCTGCDRRFKFRSQFERHLRSNPDHSTTKVLDEQ